MLFFFLIFWHDYFMFNTSCCFSSSASVYLSKCFHNHICALTHTHTLTHTLVPGSFQSGDVWQRGYDVWIEGSSSICKGEKKLHHCFFSFSAFSAKFNYIYRIKTINPLIGNWFGFVFAAIVQDFRNKPERENMRTGRTCNKGMRQYRNTSIPTFNANVNKM